MLNPIIKTMMISHGKLSPKGLQAAQDLPHFFENITIDAFYSSPFKRAIDTILPLSQSREKEITPLTGFENVRFLTSGLRILQVSPKHSGKISLITWTMANLSNKFRLEI